MSAFIAEHFIEIFFGLISAGLLAFCKHIYSQMKTYKKLVEDKDNEELVKLIEEHIAPIKDELNKLRIYVLEEEKLNKGNIELILASYKFRLVQLCQAYLKQGYMTSEQYEQLMEFYKVYSGMGGNGQGKEYFEKAIKLPIKNNN